MNKIKIGYAPTRRFVFSKEDADKVIKKLVKQEVDAVFSPHCNFGMEELPCQIPVF